MAIRVLRPEQKAEISNENAHKFMAQNPDYYGNDYNATLLVNFIESQIGKDYPWQLENFEQAFEYLKDDLQARPAKQPVYRRAQVEQHEHRLATADEVRAMKDAPLSALRILANVQRHQMKGQPRPMAAQPGSESRRVGDDQPLNLNQAARATVMSKYPHARGAEFNRRVAEETQILLGAN